MLYAEGHSLFAIHRQTPKSNSLLQLLALFLLDWVVILHHFIFPLLLLAFGRN